MTAGAKDLTDHRKVREILDAHPNTWQLASVYRSRATAQIVSVKIAENKYSKAYEKGTLETTYLPQLEGDWEVWVKLVTDD